MTTVELTMNACGLLARAGCQVVGAYAHVSPPLIRVRGTPDPAIFVPRHAYAMTDRINGVRIQWERAHG
jgi:hypothetical protein